MALSFDCIFLDTEPLIKSGWPSLSSTLKTIAERSLQLGITVFIPDAVEAEIEEHLIRDYNKLFEDISSAVRKANRQFGYLSGEEFSVALPSPSRLRERYRQASQASRTECGIKTVPFGHATLESVFKRAIERQPPFEEKGGGVVGLQDTTIFLSIVEFLGERVSQQGAIVSADAIYSKARSSLQEWALLLGGKVEFHTLEQISTLIEGEWVDGLDPRVKEAFDRDLEHASGELRKRMELIELFLKHKLMIPQSPAISLSYVFGIPRAVSSLELVDIQNLNTNFFGRLPGVLSEIVFFATVRAVIDVDLINIPAVTYRSVVQGRESRGDLPVVRVETRPIVGRVRVVGKAAVIDDEYKVIVLNSAEWIGDK